MIDDSVKQLKAYRKLCNQVESANNATSYARHTYERLCSEGESERKISNAYAYYTRRKERLSDLYTDAVRWGASLGCEQPDKPTELLV